MKYKSSALLALIMTSSIQANDLVITGVIDGPLSGGTPKAVEIFVLNDIADISICGLGSANNGNGGGTQEYTFASGAATAGSYLYISSESSGFESFMGFEPTATSGAMSVNGDDAIELFCNGVVVDTFGDINTDGSGEAWEYLDGWAYRTANTGPDGTTFVLGNWSFSGKNALDGESTNATAASAFPLKAFAEEIGDGGSDDGSGDDGGGDDGGGDEGQGLGVISGSVCTNCPDVPIIKDLSLFDATSYYASAQTEVDANSSAEIIKGAITEIISTDHKDLTYADVWTSLTYTDEDPQISNNIILWYSNRTQAKSTNGSGAASSNPDNWNREHSWPQSHGFKDSDSFEARTDIHHLRATDISINSSRGNLDFDNSDSPLAESPINRVDSDSFEPRDEIKGDVARMMFYLDTRYEGSGSDVTPDLELVNRVTTTSESKLGWLCTLAAWSAADPVDFSEQRRNDRIYQLQGNRNPFIDNPTWVEILYPITDCASGGGGGGGEGPGDGENPGDGSEPGDASGVGAILITEVMQNPSEVSDSVGEWFEIVNSGVETVNLNGWTVRDDGSDSFVIDQDVILTPGAYAILGNNSDAAINGGVSVNYAYGSQMFLSNGADELVIEDLSGNIVDEISWDGGPIWPDPTGASMTLVDFSDSNNDGTKWVAEPTETYGNGDKGTPGKSDATFSLVITEIMQNPSAVSDGSGEWFEVLNTGAIAVNLNGWTLRDDGTDSHQVSVDVIIAPGTYAVFSNNSDSASNGGVEVFYQYSGIFLANGSDELVLQRPDSSIEDQVNWDNGATFPDPNGKSMTLTSAFVDNNVGSNWIEETTKSYGNGDFGTPGSGPDGTGVGDGDTGSGPVELVFINEVQGSGDVSPLDGDTVLIEGVVSASFTDISGFFVQEEDADADADASTSEGIFVFYDGALPDVGDLVSVMGDVSEFFGRTQLTASEAPQVISTGNVLPTVSALSLPFADAEQVESLEGMLVSNAQALVVTDSFTLGRFGQVTLSTERLFVPTNIFAPGSSEAIDLEAANALNRILLDDGNSAQNPEVVIFPTGGLSASNTLRLGDTVASLTGILDYSFSEYRVIPTQDPTFIATNPRTAEPDVNLGNLKVASLNVLNYFNNIDDSGSICGPTASSSCRGADSELEFERQKAKTVAAIVAMDADIVGLMEIENNGFSEGSAIADLVAAINAIMGAGTYSIVDPGTSIGTDAITVAFIYKPSVVSLAGAAQILDSSNSISDEDGVVLFVDTKNRPSLVQEFALVENGETLVISVNHLKSKGSSCGAGDDDTTTGQGNCNLTRTRAAQALSAFLDAQYPDKATLIIGDLNAYAKEDPISALEGAGYTNLVNYFGGAEAYSYSFRGLLGYLDHALANNKTLAKVVDVTEWHINADEPVVLDYNVEFIHPANVTNFYAPDAYRMSDHDPVVIALQFDSAVAVKGDWDGDGDVDMSDVMGLISAIQARQDIDSALDMNDDGVVNILDARLIMSVCTRTRCAVE